MNQEVEPHILVVEYQRLMDVLLLPVRVSRPWVPQEDQSTRPPVFEYTALLDTGATRSGISPQVVDQCGISTSGYTDVRTAYGTVQNVQSYVINMEMPNNVGFAGLEVTQVTELSHADVLIGMDIILNSDMILTNTEGQTVLSLRFPSVGGIDFDGEDTPQEPPPRRGFMTPHPIGFRPQG